MSISRRYISRHRKSREGSIRRAFLIVLAVVFVTAAWPSLALAQVAPLDSVVGNGSDGSTTFHFNVTSGPSGENPSGTAVATLSFLVHETFTSTRVLCLAVSGNTATFAVQLAANSQDLAYAKVTVVDNSPTGDTYGAAGYRATVPDCSPITDVTIDASVILPPRPIVSGDIAVFDAPLPASEQQCKHDGWQNFPQFKNQGECVAFVEHAALIACIAERARIGQVAFRNKYGEGPRRRDALHRCVQFHGG